MLKPDFIVVGAQRAGTTWLHNCLSEHPQVSLPAEKEVHFFDLHYDKGLAWYSEKLSASHKDSSIVGEITPNYYQFPNAMERIKEQCPQAKIIFIVREPVSRAVSQFDLFKESQMEGLSFAQAIDEKPQIIDLSMQGKHLKKITQLFPKEQVCVLTFDELNQNPLMLLQKVCRFINVDEDFKPEFLNKKVNKIVFPKTQEFLKKIGLSSLIELAKKSPFSESIKRLGQQKRKNNTALNIPDVHKKQFIDDVEVLESLANLDLSTWKSKLSSQ